MRHRSRDRKLMANLIKLKDDRVELPARSFVYSITPPISKLQAGLEAFEALRIGHAAHRLPLEAREETARFLVQFGQMLHGTLFPAGQGDALDPEEPVWIAPMGEWGAYPWELLHDGRRWMALHRGVFRTTWPPPTDIQPSAPFSGPLRVLALGARPLSLEGVEDSREPGWFERFASDLALLGDSIPSSPLPVHYRVVPHATPAALEAGLAARPDVLVFSGRATAEGWWLETDRGAPHVMKWDELLRYLKQAANRGLRLAVLKDTLGFGQPLTLSARATDLQRAGLPTVIRLEGFQSRRMEHDYLRSLLVRLSEGQSVIDAHRHSLRDMFEPLEVAWGWAFPRVYEPVPAPEDASSAQLPGEGISGILHDSAPGPERPASFPSQGLEAGQNAVPASFASAPVPPLMRPRRRVFDRAAVTRQLVEYLQPDSKAPSSLVFLHGARGSGKTTVALAAAQRVRRRFGQVLYLSPRLLLPDPWLVAQPRGMARDEERAVERVLSALVRHLGEPIRAENSVLDGQTRLTRHLEQGAPTLLILDRMEGMPVYQALCEALSELPRGSRALMISRTLPPLLPGRAVEMPLLSREELAQILGAAFLARVEEADPSGRVLDRCCEDLLLARLLRGESTLPALKVLFQDGADENGKNADGTTGGALAGDEVVRVAEHAFEGLSSSHHRVLQALALTPGAIHWDTLVALAGLPGDQVRPALTDLRRRGWVDTFGGLRFHGLAARLQTWASERLLTHGAIGRMREAWLRSTVIFLTAVESARQEGPGVWKSNNPSLLAWNDEGGGSTSPAHVRLAHRLGIERANITELICLLESEGDWKGLERLTDAALPLRFQGESQDLWRVLNMAQLAGAEVRRDPLAQAQALNRLAEPLLELRRASQARPLLEHALDLLGSTPGWSVLAETYRLLSRCYEQLGRLEPAVNLLHSSVELATQLGLPEEIPPACEALGRLWLRKGEERAEARGFLEKQVEFLSEAGHGTLAASVMRVLGDYLIRTGSGEEGLTLYTEALELCRGRGADDEAATTLLRLADGHLRRGEGERALELVQMAEEQAGGGLVDPEEQGRILTGICRVFEQRNRPEWALEGYLRIKKLLESMGDRVALIGVLDRIGGLYYQLNEQDKATRCYEERLHLQEALTPS